MFVKAGKGPASEVSVHAAKARICTATAVSIPHRLVIPGSGPASTVSVLKNS